MWSGHIFDLGGAESTAWIHGTDAICRLDNPNKAPGLLGWSTFLSTDIPVMTQNDIPVMFQEAVKVNRMDQSSLGWSVRVRTREPIQNDILLDSRGQIGENRPRKVRQ